MHRQLIIRLGRVALSSISGLFLLVEFHVRSVGRSLRW